MSGPLRAALGGARVATALAASAALVTAVVIAAMAPWPALHRAPVAVAAVPAPADTSAVCAGALLAAGRVVENAATITVAAPVLPIAASSAGRPAQRMLAAPDVQGETGALAFVASPHDGVATAVTAAQSASVTSEDLSGFAADACRPALFDSWLVGGAATTGSADLVLVANPADVAATVQLTVYGTAGAVVPPGAAALIVPAHTQRVLPLAGLALGMQSPVVRVTATGAPVRASLQSSIVRTLIPGGVDLESAIAGTATTQVIPGVTVTAVPGQAGASNVATLVRVLSPGRTGAATVTVTAVGADRPALRPTSVPLAADTPTEVELGGLQPGAYTIAVTSDTPVVAAAWQTTGFGAGSDFAWFTSAPALDGPAPVAVPAGVAPVLQLTNSASVAATVTVAQDGGAAQQVTVPASGSAAVPLAQLSNWRIDPGAAADVHAMVVFAAPGAIAGFAVWPTDAAAGALRVYP